MKSPNNKTSFSGAMFFGMSLFISPFVLYLLIPELLADNGLMTLAYGLFWMMHINMAYWNNGPNYYLDSVWKHTAKYWLVSSAYALLAFVTALGAEWTLVNREEFDGQFSAMLESKALPGGITVFALLFVRIFWTHTTTGWGKRLFYKVYLYPLLQITAAITLMGAVMHFGVVAAHGIKDLFEPHFQAAADSATLLTVRDNVEIVIQNWEISLLSLLKLAYAAYCFPLVILGLINGNAYIERNFESTPLRVAKLRSPILFALTLYTVVSMFYGPQPLFIYTLSLVYLCFFHVIVGKSYLNYIRHYKNNYRNISISFLYKPNYRKA